jgi:hypothetical protein
MKRTFSLLVLAGLVLLLSSGAYADTVAIAYAINGGPLVGLVAGPGSGFALGSTSAGGWTVSGTVVGTPPNPEPDLTSLTFDFTDTSTGTNSVQLYATEIGLTSPLGVNTFLSGFTTNQIIGPIASVTESTYVDTSNGNFGTPASGLLSTTTFLGPSGTQSVTLSATTPSLPAPYSETEVFNIVATGTGGISSDTITISNSSSVPEPGTLTMFGSGLLGLAGLLRRKLALA